jgi:hypothetical protein
MGSRAGPVGFGSVSVQFRLGFGSLAFGDRTPRRASPLESFQSFFTISSSPPNLHVRDYRNPFLGVRLGFGWVSVRADRLDGGMKIHPCPLSRPPACASASRAVGKSPRQGRPPRERPDGRSDPEVGSPGSRSICKVPAKDSQSCTGRDARIDPQKGTPGWRGLKIFSRPHSCHLPACSRSPEPFVGVSMEFRWSFDGVWLEPSASVQP